MEKLSYHYRDLETKEPEAEYKADDYANARSEVLGDVVRIVDAEACQHTTNSLEDDGSPDDGVVALKEPVLGNVLSVLHNDTEEECRKEAVE